MSIKLVEFAKFFKTNVEGALKLNMRNVGTVTLSCTSVFTLQPLSSQTGSINFHLPMILTNDDDKNLAIAVFAGMSDGLYYFMCFANNDTDITFNVWQE